MKKYLGILKTETENFTGIDIRIISKFSNSKAQIEQWKKLYPNSKCIILDNNESFNDFFKDFEDFAPVTAKEKEKARKLYEDFMKVN